MSKDVNTFRDSIKVRFDEFHAKEDYWYINEYLRLSTEGLNQGQVPSDVPLAVLYVPLEVTEAYAEKLTNWVPYLNAYTAEAAKRG